MARRCASFLSFTHPVRRDGQRTQARLHSTHDSGTRNRTTLFAAHIAARSNTAPAVNQRD